MTLFSTKLSQYPARLQVQDRRLVIPLKSCIARDLTAYVFITLCNQKVSLKIVTTKKEQEKTKQYKLLKNKRICKRYTRDKDRFITMVTWGRETLSTPAY